MNTTAAANRWLNTFAKWYSVNALMVVIERAQAIAQARGSHQLGRVHLELALDELARLRAIASRFESNARTD